MAGALKLSVIIVRRAFLKSHPERMQAIPGPWPSLIREVQSIVLGDDGFGEDLDWGHDRGRDFQCLATILCLITCHSGALFPTTPKLEKWLSSTAPVDQKTRNDVLETFKIFIALVKDKKYNAAFKKPSRVSPVEFTMTGVLISRFKKTHSLTQLSNAIWQMRADIRKKFVDVRANNKVVRAMFDFLKRGFKDAELASDGKGDTPAAIAIRSAKRPGIPTVNSRTSSPEPAAPKSARKRRRVQVAASSEDAESEDEPVPAKRRASAPNLPTGSSRTAPTKATASKTAGARKVSAPARTKIAPTASTSKAATKTSNKSAKTSQPQDERTSPPPPDTSASAHRPTTQTTDPKPLTKRKTMTSMSAAADSLFLSASTATGSSPQISRTAGTSKKTAKATPSATVKMEVDPESLDTSGPPGPQDDNAMSVETDCPDSVH